MKTDLMTWRSGKIIRIPIRFWIILLSAGLYSCGKGGGGSNSGGGIIPTPPDNTGRVAGISVTPASVLLLPAFTEQLKATITPADAVNKNITWSSSNTAVAIVSALGLVTAVAEGEATISASSADNTAAVARTNIRVLKNYEVHVVGYGPSEKRTPEALYWKNGGKVALNTAADMYSYSGNSIIVSGSNVYIAGFQANSFGWLTTTLWKNSVPQSLGGPVSGVGAEYYNLSNARMTISGNDIYVSSTWSFPSCALCGNHTWNTGYWKIAGNSITHTPLIIDGTSTESFGIVANGNDLYIAGTARPNNFLAEALYWKNTVSQPVVLSTLANASLKSNWWAVATSIALQGSDVYVTGYDGCGDYVCKKTARLWKNNMSGGMALSNGQTDEVPADIFIYNNTIYIAGYTVNEAGKKIARYWKVNGNTVTAIDLSNGQTDAEGKAVFAIGEDAFVAGYEFNPLLGYKQAKYWRINGNASLAVVLPVYMSAWHSEALDIFVK